MVRHIRTGTDGQADAGAPAAAGGAQHQLAPPPRAPQAAEIEETLLMLNAAEARLERQLAQLERERADLAARPDLDFDLLGLDELEIALANEDRALEAEQLDERTREARAHWGGRIAALEERLRVAVAAAEGAGVAVGAAVMAEAARRLRREEPPAAAAQLQQQQQQRRPAPESLTVPPEPAMPGLSVLEQRLLPLQRALRRVELASASASSSTSTSGAKSAAGCAAAGLNGGHHPYDQCEDAEEEALLRALVREAVNCAAKGAAGLMERVAETTATYNPWGTAAGAKDAAAALAGGPGAPPPPPGGSRSAAVPAKVLQEINAEAYAEALRLARALCEGEVRVRAARLAAGEEEDDAVMSSEAAEDGDGRQEEDRSQQQQGRRGHRAFSPEVAAIVGDAAELVLLQARLRRREACAARNAEWAEARFAPFAQANVKQALASLHRSLRFGAAELGAAALQALHEALEDAAAAQAGCAPPAHPAAGSAPSLAAFLMLRTERLLRLPVEEEGGAAGAGAKRKRVPAKSSASHGKKKARPAAAAAEVIDLTGTSSEDEEEADGTAMSEDDDDDVATAGAGRSKKKKKQQPAAAGARRSDKGKASSSSAAGKPRGKSRQAAAGAAAAAAVGWDAGEAIGAASAASSAAAAAAAFRGSRAQAIEQSGLAEAIESAIVLVKKLEHAKGAVGVALRTYRRGTTDGPADATTGGGAAERVEEQCGGGSGRAAANRAAQKRAKDAAAAISAKAGKGDEGAASAAAARAMRNIGSVPAAVLEVIAAGLGSFQRTVDVCTAELASVLCSDA